MVPVDLEFRKKKVIAYGFLIKETKSCSLWIKQCESDMTFNLLKPGVAFLYPLKTSANLKVF